MYDGLMHSNTRIMYSAHVSLRCGHANPPWVEGLSPPPEGWCHECGIVRRLDTLGCGTCKAVGYDDPDLGTWWCPNGCWTQWGLDPAAGVGRGRYEGGAAAFALWQAGEGRGWVLDVALARDRLAVVSGSPLPEWVEDEIVRRREAYQDCGCRDALLSFAEVIDTVRADVCSGVIEGFTDEN